MFSSQCNFVPIKLYPGGVVEFVCHNGVHLGGVSDAILGVLG
jgi:hypothetical protein